MNDAYQKPLGGESNRFLGEYIGRVESTADPDKLLRVQVRVFAVFTDDVPLVDLPWAEYRLPVGSRFNDGFFIPADVGDYVWVKFPYGGDTRRPVIIGSAHYAPDGKPNFPHEAWAGPEMHTHKRTGNEPVPAENAYHEDVVFRQHGVAVEMCKDTSVRVFQQTTGTEIEIDPQGNITLHGNKNIYFSAVDHAEGIVGKNISVSVGGNADITVGGKADITVSGKTTLQSNIVEINGGGSVKGTVQGDCICALTGKPHAHISPTVLESF